MSGRRFIHDSGRNHELSADQALADLGIDLPADSYGEVAAYCPQCSPGHHPPKKTLSVRLEPDGFVFLCHRCQWKGGHRRGRRIGKDAVAPPAAKPQARITLVEQLAKLKTLWQAAHPLNAPEAELGRVYLQHRGLGGILDGVPSDLRLHPSLPYWEPDGAGKWAKLGEFPTLLAVVRDVDGKPVNLHRTFLREDGQGKADVPSPKKLMTPVRPGAGTGAAARLYPWTGGTLYLAEGVETSLAIRLIRPGAAVWSCISAGNMTRFKCPSGVERVTICCDHDANGVGRRAGRALAERLVRERKYVELTMPSDAGDWLDVLARGGLNNG
jgi:putative DNA primase/helicase